MSRSKNEEIQVSKVIINVAICCCCSGGVRNTRENASNDSRHHEPSSMMKALVVVRDPPIRVCGARQRSIMTMNKKRRILEQ